MSKNKKQKSRLNSENLKNGMQTALEVTKTAGEILVAAATVWTAAKTLKGNGKS